jgi:hypothetical protein
LAHLLFDDKGGREHDLGRVWLWQLSSSRWVRKRDCSLVFIQADPFLQRFLDQDDWFFIPLWISGTVKLPVSDHVLKSKSMRSDVRRIEEAGLQGRVTRDPERFDDFYHNMYVPHVTKAHGSSVYVNPYDTMRTRLEDGDLVLIRDGEQDIAGMMIVYDHDRPRLWSAGVRNGDHRHLDRGALTAVYRFSCDHLARKGFDSASMGLSRPFLKDGVLRYKRKWAQKIVGSVPDRIALKVVGDTHVTGAFLRNNPFIFESSGELQGAVFLSEQDALHPDTARRMKKLYFHDGVSRLILFSPHAEAARDGSLLPAAVAFHHCDHLGRRSARNLRFVASAPRRGHKAS